MCHSSSFYGKVTARHLYGFARHKDAAKCLVAGDEMFLSTGCAEVGSSARWQVWCWELPTELVNRIATTVTERCELGSLGEMVADVGRWMFER